MTAAPKLRSDLVIRPQPSSGGTMVVVKDPATRRFFRFGEVEHFVAQQLDGATPLEVVRHRVEERFGQPLSERPSGDLSNSSTVSDCWTTAAGRR
jgi:hypothetical protein